MSQREVRAQVWQVLCFVALAWVIPALLATDARASEPCCSITQIDARTGTVTAREAATGRVFEFRVPDAALLRSLRVGQGVYANFASKQVSINGMAPCCNITALTAAAPPAQPAPAAKPSGQQKPTTQTSGSSLDKLKIDTSKINASEGTTAQAIRGAAPPGPNLAAAISFSLEVAPGYVTGGDNATGKIVLKSPATSGVVLQLSSNQPQTIILPASVTLQSGASKVDFPIKTRKPPLSLTATIWVASVSPQRPVQENAFLTVGGDAANTGFDPAVQGFQFTNYWVGDILIDIPLIGRRDLGKTTYGLCGGMSYAALDTFEFKGRAPTTGKAVPPPGDRLRSYIYDRQQDSFRADNAVMLRTFIEWLPLPEKTEADITGLQVRSDREFRRNIRPALDAGHPVPLGLLKATVSDLTKGQDNALFINHQVLAIGYQLHEGHWDIHIYDPNYPGKPQTLHTGPRYETEQGSAVKTESFRALFRIPYSPKQPYWVSATPGGGGR